MNAAQADKLRRLIFRYRDACLRKAALHRWHPDRADAQAAFHQAVKDLDEFINGMTR